MTKREYYLDTVYGGVLPTKIVVTTTGTEEVQMTDEDFDAYVLEQAEVEDLSIDTEYQGLRTAEYDDSENQIDAIYKGFMAIRESGLIDLGVDCNTWLDEIAAIKEKYPKI